MVLFAPRVSESPVPAKPRPAVRATLALDPDLHTKVVQRALDNDRSKNREINALIRQALANEKVAS